MPLGVDAFGASRLSRPPSPWGRRLVVYRVRVVPWRRALSVDHIGAWIPGSLDATNPCTDRVWGLPVDRSMGLSGRAQRGSMPAPRACPLAGCWAPIGHPLAKERSLDAHLPPPRMECPPSRVRPRPFSPVHCGRAVLVRPRLGGRILLLLRVAYSTHRFLDASIVSDSDWVA